MNRPLLGTLLCGSLFLPISAQSAVICVQENTQIEELTPTEDFIINPEGTVIHPSTGLMWMRCSLGQIWDGTDCIGSASNHDWQDALQTVVAFNSGQSDPDGDQAAGFAGYTDWRLPNKNELESIVEPRCWGPAVNAALFPNTNPYWYWSSTRHTFDAGMAWRIDFSVGNVGTWYHYNYYSVRLVRSVE